MPDTSAIILIIPPIITAIFAYLVARKKNFVNERLGRAKVDAEIQMQALSIVRNVMVEMREELKREIDTLKKENDIFRTEIHENKIKIDSLQLQLTVSNELTTTLRSEIGTLRSALRLYEEENARLKKIG